MEEIAKSLQNNMQRRLLIASLHVIGWVTFLSLPFLFFEPPRFRKLMPGMGPGDMKLHRGEYLPHASDFDVTSMRWHFILGTIPLMIFFYLNMYVLIPRVLSKKSWVHYLFAVVTGFGIVVLTNELGDVLFCLMGTPDQGGPYTLLY